MEDSFASSGHCVLAGLAKEGPEPKEPKSARHISMFSSSLPLTSCLRVIWRWNATPLDALQPVQGAVCPV